MQSPLFLFNHPHVWFFIHFSAPFLFFVCLLAIISLPSQLLSFLHENTNAWRGKGDAGELQKKSYNQKRVLFEQVIWCQKLIRTSVPLVVLASFVHFISLRFFNVTKRKEKRDLHTNEVAESVVFPDYEMWGVGSEFRICCMNLSFVFNKKKVSLGALREKMLKFVNWIRHDFCKNKTVACTELV